MNPRQLFPANRTRRLRRTLGLLAATVLAVAGAQVAAAGVASGAERDPVIFVHGYSMTSESWADMMADFLADGYSSDELYAWDYDTAQSNKTTAEEFVAVVDDMLAKTGAAEVDVVTHSMGGLNTRWYLKFLGGSDKVDDWVSLAGPNHGTINSGFCYALHTSCQEMMQGSDFLLTLNDGDETPGTTDYGTWWSQCDEIINPSTSTILDGATNTQTHCLEHLMFLSDPIVSQQVRDFVR
ncbi:esterase/lipase family protein [Haloechinothrix halophila]|uniref:esterase/lipase family protein n=1 Tax=Haloechinothrix halophila TaxID=1069073 RepID=UPI00040645A0|nr:triacylglycerol lipase [Haloechinothrix halophila]